MNPALQPTVETTVERRIGRGRTVPECSKEISIRRIVAIHSGQRATRSRPAAGPHGIEGVPGHKNCKRANRRSRRHNRQKLDTNGGAEAGNLRRRRDVVATGTRGLGMLLVDLALNLEIQAEVRTGHRRRNVATRVGAHHTQRAVPRSLRAMRWLQPQPDMVIVHGLKRDIARPKAILATHKPARLEAIEGSLRNVEVVVAEVRSAKSRAVGSSTRLGSKQPSRS